MKKALYITLTAAVFGVLYIAFYHPDQIVEPSISLKEAAGVSSPAAIIKPLAAPTPPVSTNEPQLPATASTSKPVNQPVISQPSQQPEATSVPSTNNLVTNYNPNSVLNGGFGNYCYRMTNGSWTTVIYQGAGGSNMYPYNGPTDPTTDAPATAVGSEAWCAANAPVASQ